MNIFLRLSHLPQPKCNQRVYLHGQNLGHSFLSRFLVNVFSQNFQSRTAGKCFKSDHVFVPFLDHLKSPVHRSVSTFVCEIL